MAGTIKVPANVQVAAREGLKLRGEHKRGGIGPGQTTARRLASGTTDLAHVRKISSYLARHAVDKQGKDWDKPSNGKIAWLLWGGDPAVSWCKSTLASAETAALWNACVPETAAATPEVIYTVEAIDGDGTLLQLLEYLQKCGHGGHSVSFKIDDQSFGFDGDGADKIVKITKG